MFANETSQLMSLFWLFCASLKAALLEDISEPFLIRSPATAAWLFFIATVKILGFFTFAPFLIKNLTTSRLPASAAANKASSPFALTFAPALIRIFNAKRRALPRVRDFLYLRQPVTPASYRRRPNFWPRHEKSSYCIFDYMKYFVNLQSFQNLLSQNKF